MSVALPQLNSPDAFDGLAGSGGDGGVGGVPPGGPGGGLPGGTAGPPGGPDGGGPDGGPGGGGDGGWCVGAMNLVYQRCSELNRPRRPLHPALSPQPPHRALKKTCRLPRPTEKSGPQQAAVRQDTRC